jgi:UDP-N-acetylmuramoylalanine--D-glutamate ligase
MLKSKLASMFKDKKIAILGFGMEGKDLAAYLLERGAVITIFDKKPEAELDLAGIDKEEFTFSTGTNYLEAGLEGFDYIFRSPGVYRFAPQIVKAEEKGVKVSSAIELFFQECPGKIIGVTGTKGKGTTSSLVYEILKKAGKDAYLAGNIGVAYLQLLSKLGKDSLVVLELSSFQLIGMDKSPQIAVVLNITQDHLDWHQDLDEYISAKKNIVKHQSPSDFTVINADYPLPQGFSSLTPAKTLFFSRKQKVEGSYQLNGKIYLSVGAEELLGETSDLLLRGEHNLENITAAVCVAGILNIAPDTIWEAVASFKGLEHRLELVGEAQGFTFYNDSFATGPQPTIAAIKSFKEPLTVILGGSDKGLDYSALGEEISKSANIASIVLIGQIAPKIKKAVEQAGFKGQIIQMGKSPMSEIVKAAILNTPKTGVILLSPAAASFDMFRDYKDRGYQFKSVVKALG